MVYNDKLGDNKGVCKLCGTPWLKPAEGDTQPWQELGRIQDLFTKQLELIKTVLPEDMVASLAMLGGPEERQDATERVKQAFRAYNDTAKAYREATTRKLGCQQKVERLEAELAEAKAPL